MRYDGGELEQGAAGPFLVLGVTYNQGLKEAGDNLRRGVVFAVDVVVQNSPEVQRGQHPRLAPRPALVVGPDEAQEGELAEDVEESVREGGTRGTPPMGRVDARAVGYHGGGLNEPRPWLRRERNMRLWWTQSIETKQTLKDDMMYIF